MGYMSISAYFKWMGHLKTQFYVKDDVRFEPTSVDL